MLTHGVSPKVLLPFLTGVAAGAVLLIAGLVAHDPTLKAAGSGVLLAAAAHAGIGYVAPSGPVVVDAVAQDSPPVVASTTLTPAAKPAARPAAKKRA